MKEASPLKFYLAKFLFLGFALVQWTVAVTILLRFGFHSQNLVVAIIFALLGASFFSVFVVINRSVRRVAVGKNKIVIIEGEKNLRYEWPEVKSLKLIPFFNMYKLKVKGQEGAIYFFPSKKVHAAFGLLSKDTSRMGEIVSKRKKEFGIK